MNYITDRQHLMKVAEGIIEDARALAVVESNEHSHRRTRRRRHVPGPGRHLAGGADVTKRTCSVRGCDREYLARGWCNAHYHRWKATGDVEADRPVREVIPDPVERFWSKVDRGDGGADDCWLWTGVKSHDGYGITTHDSTRTYAHRFAWELLVGPIPEGMTLDHLCRVRGCVRAPEHLSVVTIQENMRRGMGLAAVNARKTHCKYGHPFDEQNTWVGRKGQRKCRTCMRLAKRKARRRAGRAGR